MVLTQLLCSWTTGSKESSNLSQASSLKKFIDTIKPRL